MEDHTMRLCIKTTCDQKTCSDRHPGLCNQIRDFGCCWWRQCSYRHERPGQRLVAESHQETPQRAEKETVLLVGGQGDTGGNEIILGLQQKFGKLEEELKDLDRRWKEEKAALEGRCVELSSKLQESRRENAKLEVKMTNQEVSLKFKIKAIDDSIMLSKEKNIKLEEKVEAVSDDIGNEQVTMKKKLEFTDKDMEQIWYKFESIQEEIRDTISSELRTEMEEKFSSMDQVLKLFKELKQELKSLREAQVEEDRNAKGSYTVQLIYESQQFDRQRIQILETEMKKAKNMANLTKVM